MPKPRGTQNLANLKAILENRQAKPRLADLRVQARELGIAGRSRMNAETLRAEVAKATRAKERAAPATGSAPKRKMPASRAARLEHASMAEAMQRRDRKFGANNPLPLTDARLKVARKFKATNEKIRAAQALQAAGLKAPNIEKLEAKRERLASRAAKLNRLHQARRAEALVRHAAARAGETKIPAVVGTAKAMRQAMKGAAPWGALKFGLIMGPALAALTAFDATKSRASAAGLSNKEGTLRAGKAAVVAGGVGAGIAAAASAAVKLGPKMLARAIPGVGLALAVEGAREGLKAHGPAGALFGALGLDDLAAMAKHKAEAVLLPPPSERHEAIVPRSSEFVKANATFHAMQTAKTSPTTLRGWANPTTQAAAKAAQGKRFEPTR
jgi:hypothetical protein